MPWPKQRAGSPRTGRRQRAELGQLRHRREPRRAVVAARDEPGMSLPGRRRRSSARQSATIVCFRLLAADRVELGEVAQQLRRGEGREVAAHGDVPAVAGLAQRDRQRQEVLRAPLERQREPDQQRRLARRLAMAAIAAAKVRRRR